jgi:septum site-determining protein MinC
MPPYAQHSGISRDCLTMKKPQQPKPAFQLKGSVVTLSVLQILNPEISAIVQQLEETVQKNPNFFQNMPVIIDLQKIYNLDYDINFSEINLQLKKKGFVPVGVSNGNAKQLESVADVGLGIMPNTKTANTTKSTTPAKKVERSKIYNQPIRSGQQIYAKNSDLVILASVSHGAEVLADGNIHVYGALRGRAIAGVTGDTNAYIFCHRLEAELISIAGYYKVHEDIKSAPNSEVGTQIFLENEHLMIASIGQS